MTAARATWRWWVFKNWMTCPVVEINSSGSFSNFFRDIFLLGIGFFSL
jgi:hypothetical protein